MRQPFGGAQMRSSVWRSRSSRVDVSEAGGAAMSEPVIASPQSGEVGGDGIELLGGKDLEGGHQVAGLDVLAVADEAGDVGLGHGLGIEADGAPRRKMGEVRPDDALGGRAAYRVTRAAACGQEKIAA